MTRASTSTAAIKRWLSLELIVVFFAVPLLLALRLRHVTPIPILIFVALCGYGVLHLDERFDRRHLFIWPSRELPAILFRTLCLCATIGLGVWWFAPALLFDFVQRAPGAWALVMILYPLLSVYPQEFLYRAYFFHRYRPLFRNDMSLVLASSLAFGFVHIIFGNWISVGLSAMGGILFSITYLHTGSLLAACLEHAIFGDFIFTIGLGQFFYHGRFGQ